jgi:hypothetical protein
MELKYKKIVVWFARKKKVTKSVMGTNATLHHMEEKHERLIQIFSNQKIKIKN